MNIPDEDSEAGQTGKYCLVAIGRLQVCISDVSWIWLYSKGQSLAQSHIFVHVDLTVSG